MIEDIHDEVLSELKNRATWEDRQATWFKMRYEGIKRAKRPYSNAPDMHYPLGDTMVEKLKPFYISLIYIQERLSAFTSGKPQTAENTSLGEQFFDYVLKQKTNFERAIHTAIDYMLMYGRCPVKVYWDATLKKLCYNPVRPIYLLTPSWTEELCDSDWSIEVQHLSEAQYRRNPLFNQDDAFIKRIKGTGKSTENSGTNAQEQAKYARQGITYGQNDSQIVIWECYTRDSDGKIFVETMSPILGPKELVREGFGMPYSHKQIPFGDLRYELADADYYSPRGIVEILSQFELDLCKLWNHKLQYLDFFGQPMFTNDGTASNPQNYAPSPGRILPQGVEPVPPASAPMDFQQEMQLQRALAEDRIQIPDLSAGEHLVGKRGAKGGTTATQIDALMAQSNSGNDMRARTFRLQLGTIYNQSWSIICDYMKGDQLILEDYTPVPPEVLHLQYRISPSGSADSSYSKEQRVAKAMAYKQAYAGDPSIKQNELTKWTLEQDNPDLVRRFYQEPAEAQQNQGERQAEEIVLMLNGYPPHVKKDDNDGQHVMTMAQWVEWRLKSGQPIPPPVAQMLLQHGIEHQQSAMMKRDKQSLQQIKSDPTIQQATQALEGIMSQAQQQQQAAMPDNGTQGGPLMPPGQAAPPQQEDKPSAVGNMLASLMKAGAPVSLDDINGVLVNAGLAPIHGASNIVTPPPKPTAAPAKA